MGGVLSAVTRMGGAISQVEKAVAVAGAAVVVLEQVVLKVLKLFSTPPASPPPQVQAIAAIAATAPKQERSSPAPGPPPPHVHTIAATAATAPTQERSSPAPAGNVGTVLALKADQGDEAVRQELARIIKEARQKVGVDCENYYNLAVCGQSGVGKSSFVNGFLDLNGPNACSVGEVETTQKIQKYSTNRAPYLMVWDIPGAGTLNHPADTYFEDKKLYVFDAILILSSERFLAVDFGILRSARKYGTPSAFVRTKCDVSVHSRAQRDDINTLIASQRIRRDVKSDFDVSLANAGFKDITPAPQLFFISNNYFLDEDAYALYNKKTKVLDNSLSSMDELELTNFVYDAAKIRAPKLKV